MAFTEKIKKMVLGAVKCAPATAQSRTDHLRSRYRAQTPHPHMDSDTCEGGIESESCSELRAPGSSSALAGGDTTTCYEESDSAAKMALLAESFQKSTDGAAGKHPTATSIQARTAETVTSTEMSCPDETLSAIREEAIEENANIVPKPKRGQEKTADHTARSPDERGVFAEIGWTRSFISGPADPLHNPCMVWCHICKMNISIKTKRTFETLRHHRSQMREKS